MKMYKVQFTIFVGMNNEDDEDDATTFAAEALRETIPQEWEDHLGVEIDVELSHEECDKCGAPIHDGPCQINTNI